MTTFIICYDITDDKRRSSVAKTLEGYGDRRQYSVFECHLSDTQFLSLWRKLEKAIDELEDSVLCYELNKQSAAKAKALGVAVPLLEEKGYYIA